MTTFDQATVGIRSVQLELSLAPLVTPVYAPDMCNACKFAAFHNANPHVADDLTLLADQWLRTHDRVGMGALFEALRWESGIQTTGDVYTLNNNHRAFYSRLLIERRPEWAAAIEVRAQEAESPCSSCSTYAIARSVA